MNGNFCTVVTMIFLPCSMKRAGRPSAVGVAHGGAHLHELLDGLLDLVVEDAPVGHDDDRVEEPRGSSCASRR
jgi:hypothetical protein